MIPTLYLLLVVLIDVRTRRFPLWLGVLAIVLGLVYEWSWWGFVVGLGLGLVADVPGGDLRAMAFLGALVGPVTIAWTLSGAFLLTLWAWRRGLTGVPWTVYLGLVYPPIIFVSHSVAH